MHKIENKCLFKEEINYGVGTWYINSTLKEQKKKIGA